MIICDVGSTQNTKKFIMDNLYKIGEVISVKHIADHDAAEFETIIEGEKDSIKIIGGLSSGYRGEGPRGLKYILVELGMPADQAERYALSRGGFRHIF